MGGGVQEGCALRDLAGSAVSFGLVVPAPALHVEDLFSSATLSPTAVYSSTEHGERWRERSAGPNSLSERSASPAVDVPLLRVSRVGKSRPGLLGAIFLYSATPGSDGR